VLDALVPLVPLELPDVALLDDPLLDPELAPLDPPLLDALPEEALPEEALPEDEHWPASQLPLKSPVPSAPPQATNRTTTNATSNAAALFIRPADVIKTRAPDRA
jgi:hypothetical protein